MRVLHHTIRTAMPPDAPAIAALVNEAFETEAFFKRGDRTDVEEILRLMDRGRFLVIDDHETGSLVASVYAELNGATAYFGMLSVRPALQGQGIAQRLIDIVEARARAARCERMEIRVVNLRTELVPYYQRRGYAETGRLAFSDHSTITQPCHYIVMTKPLGAGPAPARTEHS